MPTVHLCLLSSCRDGIGRLTFMHSSWSGSWSVDWALALPTAPLRLCKMSTTFHVFKLLNAVDVQPSAFVWFWMVAEVEIKQMEQHITCA